MEESDCVCVCLGVSVRACVCVCVHGCAFECVGAFERRKKVDGPCLVQKSFSPPFVLPSCHLLLLSLSHYLLVWIFAYGSSY